MYDAMNSLNYWLQRFLYKKAVKVDNIRVFRPPLLCSGLTEKQPAVGYTTYS